MLRVSEGAWEAVEKNMQELQSMIMELRKEVADLKARLSRAGVK